MAMLTPLPAWMKMWATALAIYAVCKVLSWTARRVPAPAGKHVAYLLLWPGMNADEFLKAPSTTVTPPHWREWLFATGKLLFGLFLIGGVCRKVAFAGELGQGWIGMIGLVFILHFGLFHLLSCGFRLVGINAVPLMDWPILSVSVAEFWGRRWNRAFRDLTHRFLFLPYRRTWGPIGALALGFLASGLVHELVITVPAGGGYGLPTVYFVLQAAGLLGEKSRSGQSLGLGHGIAGRLFAVAVIAVPCPLLFPPPFVIHVIRPCLVTLGALP